MYLCDIPYNMLHNINDHMLRYVQQVSVLHSLVGLNRTANVLNETNSTFHGCTSSDHVTS